MPAAAAVLVSFVHEVAEALSGRAGLGRHLQQVVVDDLIAAVDRVGQSLFRGTGHATVLLHECLDQVHQPGGYLVF